MGEGKRREKKLRGSKRERKTERKGNEEPKSEPVPGEQETKVYCRYGESNSQSVSLVAEKKHKR